MDAKSRLLELKWNSFRFYPPQGSDVYLHCCGQHPNTLKSEHRFLRVRNFNAAKLDVHLIMSKLQPRLRWIMTWLPSSTVNKKVLLENTLTSAKADKPHPAPPK